MSGGRIRPESVRLKDAASNVIPFSDGLISLLTGMGTTTDQRSYSHYFARPMTGYEIDQAYRGSWVMRKAIDKPATEMVREWRDWQADSADIAKIETEEKRLDLRNKVRRAEIMRGLGGGGMVLYVGGSPEEQATPLDPTKVRAGDLKTIHVWHRSRFGLGEMITDWTDPWFGYPSYFEVQLQGSTGAGPLRFHPSRVVAFKGEHVGDVVGTSWLDQFWGQSKVQSIIDAIKNVDTADSGFAALITQARLRRISIPYLMDILTKPGGEEDLGRRLQAFALGESNNGVSWIDGGDSEGKNAEKIEDVQVTWTGMPDIMNAYRVAAAAAADMPATVLWGTSPQGMNATGDSDIQLWHKTVKGRQDLDLSPCMTQIDSALIPSALGRVDDTIWYEWAPLSTQSEKDEATTFKDTMTGVDTLRGTALVPDIALEKATQNLIEERGWLPGLGDALAELPEDERFPSLSEPAPTDPSALQSGGGDQTTGAGIVPPTRRAANDSRFTDATPRTLYVRRDVVNVADIKAWAKSQGLPELQPGLHVTIAHIDQAFDWMKIEGEWNQDAKGEITVQPGGVRIIEPLGDRTAVLLFTSSPLSWRHEQILRAAEYEDRWPSYQPHISLTDQPVDLSKVEPYRGKIVLGPEIFEPVDDDFGMPSNEG